MGLGKKSPDKKPFQINLLIHKGEQTPITARFIKWLISSGRFIVILVELITIGAFVMRYKLDAELVDTKEKIKTKVPYIQSLKADEIAIRQTQFQLTTIKQIKEEGSNFSQIIIKLAQETPTSIKLTNLSFDRTQDTGDTTVSISGNTPSNLELSAFIRSLKKDPAFFNITLTNISFEGQTAFTISGSLTGKGGKSS